MKQYIYILIIIFSVFVCSCLFESVSENNDSVWKTVISESGISRCLRDASGKYFARRLYAGKTGTEIEFGVSKTVGTEGKDGAFGVVFWFVDWNNYYALDIDTDCSFSVTQCTDGTVNTIGSGTNEHALKKGRGTENVIKMTASGGFLHIYANCPESSEAGDEELFELNYSASGEKLAPPRDFGSSFGRLYFRALVPSEAKERQAVSFRMISAGAEDAEKTTDYKNGFQDNAAGTKRVFYCDEESWSGKTFSENARIDSYEKSSRKFALGIKKISGSLDWGRGFAFCCTEKPSVQYYFFCIDGNKNYYAGKVQGTDISYYHADDDANPWQEKPLLQKSDLLQAGTEENIFYVEARRGFFSVRTDANGQALIECFDDSDSAFSPEKGTVRFLAGVGDERDEDLKHEAVELEFRMIALTPRVVISKKTDGNNAGSSTNSELSLEAGGSAVLSAEEKNGCTGVLSYQWYVTNSENKKTKIPNAQGKEYTVSAEKTGAYTYTCEITNTVPAATKEKPSATGEGTFVVNVS
ncbi:MAG: hypothetical protein NC041_03750 [Bacteroides sp.]|nr:hypothetical protein [Prevotella sp.]MCM1408238.1 hypothetical protein [Treponema brennaborense]MCM1469562.1 hypothetical protein [Bacteroides sp.]